MTLLGLFLLGLTAGQMTGQFTGSNTTEYMAGAAACTAGALWITWRSMGRFGRRIQVDCILLLLIFCSGGVWGYADIRGRMKERETLLAEQKVTLSGTVREVKSGGYVVDTEHGRVLVKYYGEGSNGGKGKSKEKENKGEENTEKGENIENTNDQTDMNEVSQGNEDVTPGPGDGIRFTGSPEELSAGTNPGGFDAKEYYESEGIVLQINADEIDICEEKDSLYRKILAGIREAEKKGIYAILPEKEAGVLSAMLLGERAGVDKELKELYQRNGIAHILAISGLHVSLLGSAFLFILLFLHVPRGKASVVTIFFLLFYGALTGFSPATLRAILMLSSVHLSGVFRRVSDMPTAMTVTLTVILLVNPYRSTSPGLMMSFLAVAGVVATDLLYRDIFGRERFLWAPVRLRSPIKKLTGSLILSFLVQLFLLPVLIRDYYAVTPYSVLLNLLVIPLLTFAVGFGALGLLFALIPGLTPVGEIVAAPAGWIIRFYEWLCRKTLSVPGSEVVTGHISIWEMLIMIGAAFLTVYLFHRRFTVRKNGKRKGKFLFVLLVPFLILSLFITWAILRNRFTDKVVFFSVGQGDGCLIHTKDADILMDFGSSSKEKVGEEVLFPGLKYYGITHVDLAVLSHTDVDHVSGIAELLEDGKEQGITVDGIAFADGTKPDEMMMELLSDAEESGTKVEYLKKGDVITAGDFRMEVLLPYAGETGSGNEFSLVAMVTVGSLRILYTGDIGAETEERLLSDLSQTDPPDMLKVPHHGSAYSSSQVFLSAFAKEGSVALISCGKKNIYGHPAPATLERLREAGFTIYRTDRMGAVVVYP
jgi:competence protein ComEC